jgi:cytochrome c biogenesis protein CcmG/thiol:disulfide interchange protein DsbE
MSARGFLPLAAFLLLLALLYAGLARDPRAVSSTFIGKPAPAFRLARLDAPERIVAHEDLRGQVWLLNIWASWCASCRAEHPVLLDFSQRGLAPVVGVNYKDRREDALSWLARHGDPYRMSLADEQGRLGIEYGVYGTPETFVIDRQGIVRLRHAGPLTARAIEEKIIPLIKELQM